MIAQANRRRDRFVGWRAHRSKEKYYFNKVREIMGVAKEAVLIEPQHNGSLGNKKTAKTEKLW